MKTFTDNTGRAWSITLNLGSAMAVKDAVGVDLLQPEAGDPPLLTRLGTDEMLLGEVLCAMLAPQFETHRVTAEDLRNSFDGATLLAAQNAFYEELEGFFLARGRTDRAKAVAKQRAMITAAIEAMAAKVDAVDVEAVIARIGGNSSGESPGPSESTPAP